MKVAVIQASSQNEKNKLLYEYTKQYAVACEVVNFGCTDCDDVCYSYVEISAVIGLLLASGSVDFVVTGCSSGQGMMLACNSMPGVFCGYAPTPQDAYLFVQINNGNAISLPLGEEYTYAGEDNLRQTIQAIFIEPFGQGYPKSEAERKRRDIESLKKIRAMSQIEFLTFFNKLDEEIQKKVFRKTDVMEYILQHGTNEQLCKMLLKTRNENL